MATWYNLLEENKKNKNKNKNQKNEKGKRHFTWTLHTIKSLSYLVFFFFFFNLFINFNCTIPDKYSVFLLVTTITTLVQWRKTLLFHVPLKHLRISKVECQWIFLSICRTLDVTQLNQNSLPSPLLISHLNFK